MFIKKIIKWFGENKENTALILVAFITWRIWLQVFLLLGLFTLPLRERFAGGGSKGGLLTHPELWSWANFDGEHYLAIAQHGYGNLEQAFFPFFPSLIKTLAYPFQENLFALLLSGLTISNLSFLIALFLLYRLVRLDFDKKIALWTVIFILIFPTSFFFGALYTEGLFLALILGSFYAARREKWWLAGLLGALASATRLVGIFLLPALLWEWWCKQAKRGGKIKVKSLPSLLAIFLIATGLVYYMNYLRVNYQDFLMFLHVQPDFGAGRTADKLILLHQVLWRYFKMIATTKFDPLYFTVWLELLSAVGFLALLGFSYIKKIRLSYLIFALLAFLAPTLTGTFSSIPRYVLIMFPCFIGLALVENRLFRFLWVVVSLLLLVAATILFTRGYFIA